MQNNKLKTELMKSSKSLRKSVVGSALPPRKINHGDVWRRGKDWFTFYCPNEQCKRQVSGETECPYCGQKIDWGSS